MAGKYTAVVKRSGRWWIGWIEEVPGVNCQERPRKALLESLQVTLGEALRFNRAERSAVPRHSEINNHLAKKICRDLGIPEPERF